MLLVLIYVIAGYWAANKTIYANKVMIGGFGDVFIWKACTGVVLGWVLIPVAIIKSLCNR